MQKAERHNSILKLIVDTRIVSQSDLAARLREEDFSVTQASVSRDLDELGVIKLDGRYSLPAKSRSALDFGILKLEPVGENLVVARCEAGLASAAAVKIDAVRIPAIVGTIAGDDTIFIAVTDARAQKSVIRKIWELFDR
ncbi:MAG: hypothetical protein WBD22_08560 [Pyrinomonadaceae bacterium]